MIIQMVDKDVLVSESFQEKKFTIDEKSNHIIFDILRSKVYKDPIGSIAREISSNCRDAHRQNGNPDVQIEIEIQDRTNSITIEDGINLIFRDFGTGISPKAIDEIYLKYGASTKRNSNNLTGGYGLGSKTPFAYSDAFMVRTVQDEIEYLYSIYIDKTLEGRAALLKEDFAEGVPNGTEIIIPIKTNADREKFEKAVIKSTYFWKVRPKLINFKEKYKNLEIMPLMGKSYDTPLFKVFKREQFLESSVNAIIDGIYYPIDTNLVDIISGLHDFAVCIYFNNGVLPLQASREALQYDDDSISMITENLREFFNELSQKYISNFKNAKNYYDACCLYDTLITKDQLFKKLSNKAKFYYDRVENGLVVEQLVVKNSEIRIKMIDVMIVKEAKYKVAGALRTEKQKEYNLFVSSIKDLRNRIYYISAADAAAGVKWNSDRNRTLMQAGPFVLIQDDTEKVYLTSNGHKTTDEYQKALEKDVAELLKYGLDLKPYKNVPKTRKDRPKVEKRYSKKNKLSLYRYKKNSCYKYDYYHSDGDIIDENENKLKDILVVEVGDERDTSKQMLLRAVSEIVGRISNNLIILTVPTAKLKLFAKYITLEKFISMNRRKIREIYRKSKLAEFLYLYENYKNYGLKQELLEPLKVLDTVKKSDAVDFDYFNRYYGDCIKDFKAPDLSEYQAVFEGIQATYPNLSRHFGDDYCRFYVKNIDLEVENVAIKRELEEKNALLQEYVAKFDKIKQALI